MRSFFSIFLFWLLIDIPLISWSFKNDDIIKANYLTDTSDTTIIYRKLQEINVYPQNNHKIISANQYARMIQKIRKVYPFAKEAALELQLYNEKFKTIDNSLLKKQYVKKVEKELFAKHENEIKHLTIS